MISKYFAVCSKCGFTWELKLPKPALGTFKCPTNDSKVKKDACGLIKGRLLPAMFPQEKQLYECDVPVVILVEENEDRTSSEIIIEMNRSGLWPTKTYYS